MEQKGILAFILPYVNYLQIFIVKKTPHAKFQKMENKLENV